VPAELPFSATHTDFFFPDLKNTSDDAIPNYLNSLKFKQSHTLIDVRLALGYSALLIAGACFAWDYKLGWDDTKYYTAAAVALYTLVNGALTLWIWLVEKGVVYQGTSPSGEKVGSFPPSVKSTCLANRLKVTISTHTKKNVPEYNVKVVVDSPKSPQSVIEFVRPFAGWFDAEGHFVTVPFQEMLATAVPSVGKLDSRRIAKPTEPESQYSEEVLDALLTATSSASATGSAAGTEAAANKTSKRRKA
jgi:hypothetical protein